MLSLAAYGKGIDTTLRLVPNSALGPLRHGDEGWVSVGISHDTAQSAVASIRRWRRKMAQDCYPAAAKLLITADAGESNGYRTRSWKVAEQSGDPPTEQHLVLICTSN